MPSLIGSAPNQVPTNGMLGTMAFQDADNASVATKAVTDNSTFPATTAFVKESQKQKEAVTTTTGTATAYLLSPAFTPTEYYAGQTFFVKFHTTSGTSPTINIAGLGAKPLLIKEANGTVSDVKSGEIQNTVAAAIRYNGFGFEVVDSLPASYSEAANRLNEHNLITPSNLRYALNATGSAPIYACRAWVNFDGTLASGDLRRASGNVSSITDLGTGDYRITFTTELPSSNYAVVITGSTTSFANNAALLYTTEAPTTTTVRVRGCSSGANALDLSTISVSIFV